MSSNTPLIRLAKICKVELISDHNSKVQIKRNFCRLKVWMTNVTKRQSYKNDVPGTNINIDQVKTSSCVKSL